MLFSACVLFTLLVLVLEHGKKIVSIYVCTHVHLLEQHGMLANSYLLANWLLVQSGHVNLWGLYASCPTSLSQCSLCLAQVAK